MAAPPPLTDEELYVIREFFNSSTARHLFQQIEHRLIMAWMNTQDAASRESVWVDLQALHRLIIALRDAEGLRQQEMRSQPNPTGV
jgi:hypothetical protein